MHPTALLIPPVWDSFRPIWVQRSSQKDSSFLSPSRYPPRVGRDVTMVLTGVPPVTISLVSRTSRASLTGLAVRRQLVKKNATVMA